MKGVFRDGFNILLFGDDVQNIKSDVLFSIMSNNNNFMYLSKFSIERILNIIAESQENDYIVIYAKNLRDSIYTKLEELFHGEKSKGSSLWNLEYQNMIKILHESSFCKGVKIIIVDNLIENNISSGSFPMYKAEYIRSSIIYYAGTILNITATNYCTVFKNRDLKMGTILKNDSLLTYDIGEEKHNES